MTPLCIILLCLASGLSLWAGWLAGVWLMNKKMNEENIFLREQHEKMKETIRYWSDQATFTMNVTNQSIQNHNTNLGNTLHTIIQLLHSLQQQDQTNLSSEDKKRVENILSQARLITPTNGAY